MRESCTSGSVRGARGNSRPYRNRREFITLVGGAAVAWPLAACAQQPAMPVIGFFHLTSLETNRENLATFRQGLADSGYIEGKNVAIEYRWAQGRNDMLPTLVAELVRLRVSVIVVLESTNGALAAKAASRPRRPGDRVSAPSEAGAIQPMPPRIVCCTCSRPELALFVESLQCTISGAIGGAADMPTSPSGASVRRE